MWEMTNVQDVVDTGDDYPLSQGHLWQTQNLPFHIAIDTYLIVVEYLRERYEPWDLGSGGYQVGGFPSSWSEWNGRYRDCVRRHLSVSQSKSLVEAPPVACNCHVVISTLPMRFLLTSLPL